MGINQTKGQATVSGPSDTDTIVESKHKPENELWKPDRLNPAFAKLNEDIRKTMFLRRSVTNLLNKLTPENLPTLSDKMKTLPIDTSIRMQQVVEIIHQKAILEWKFRALYAKMCEHMRDAQVIDEEGLVKSFLFFLITHCEMFFRNSLSREFRFGGQKHEINLCFNLEIENSLMKDYEEKKLEFRKKSVGNCQFIGELFKVHLIDPRIIFSFLDRLLEKDGNLAVECSCALLETIGLFYEKKFEKLPAVYFDKLESLLSSTKLTPRVGFLIQDVLDLKKNFWRPRRLLELPKTSKQIEQEIAAMSRLDSILKLIKSRSEEECTEISNHFSDDSFESKNIQSENQTKTSVPTTKGHSFEHSVHNILENLTPDNFGQLSNMMKKFPISNVVRLNCIADSIFEQITNKPENCKLFAKMCSTLKNVRVADGGETTMLNTLIDKCQRQFDTDKTLILEQNKGDFRQKSVFHFRFFGELFNVQVLPSIFIFNCIKELLKSSSKESLECLYELLNVAGKYFICKLMELRGEELNELFDEFQYLLENNSRLSPELKSVLEDLLSMREVKKPVKMSEHVTDRKLVKYISSQFFEVVSSKNRQNMKPAETIISPNSVEKTSPSLKKFHDAEKPFEAIIRANSCQKTVTDEQNISVVESNEGFVAKQSIPSKRTISASDSSKTKRTVDVALSSPKQYSVEFCKSLRELPRCKKSVNVPNYLADNLYSNVPITPKNQRDEPKKTPSPSHIRSSLENNVPSCSSVDSQTPVKSTSVSKKMSANQKKTRDLYHSVNSILNEFTPENLDSLIERIRNLPINNPSKFRAVIQLIYNKGIKEPENCYYYAEMICKLQIPVSEGEDKLDNFEQIDEVDQKINEPEMVELDLKLNTSTTDEQLEKKFGIFFDESNSEILFKENQVETILSKDPSSTELFEWLKISFQQWTSNGKLPIIDCFETTKSQLKSKLHPGIVLELIEFVLKNYPNQANKCGQMLVYLILHGYIRSKAVIKGFEYYLNTVENHQISSEVQILLNPLFESGFVKPDDLNSVSQYDLDITPTEIKKKDTTVSQKKSASKEIAKNLPLISQPLIRSAPGHGILIPLSSYFDPFFNFTKNTSDLNIRNVENYDLKPATSRSRPLDVKNDDGPLSWRNSSLRNGRNDDVKLTTNNWNARTAQDDDFQLSWRNLNLRNDKYDDVKLITNNLNAQITKKDYVKPSKSDSSVQAVKNDDGKPATKKSGPRDAKTENSKSTLKNFIAQNVKTDDAKPKTSNLSAGKVENDDLKPTTKKSGSRNAKTDDAKLRTSDFSAQNAKKDDAKPKTNNMSAERAENEPATRNLIARTVKNYDVKPATSYSSVLRKAENDIKPTINSAVRTVKNDDLKPTTNKSNVQKAKNNDVKSGTSNSSVKKVANNDLKPKTSNSSSQTAKNSDVKPSTSSSDKNSAASKSKAQPAKNPEIKPAGTNKIVPTSKNLDVKPTTSDSSQRKAIKTQGKSNPSKPSVQKPKNNGVTSGTNNSKRNAENNDEKPTIRQLIKNLLKSQTPEKFNPLKFSRELNKIRLQKAAELELAASCMIKMVENNPELNEFYIDLCDAMMMLTVENKKYWTMLMKACHSYFHQNILPEDKPKSVFVIVTPEEEIKEENRKNKLKGFCRFFSLLVNKLDNETANESVQRIMRKLLDVRKIDYFCEIYEHLDPDDDRFEKSLFESHVPKLLSSKELEKGFQNMLRRVADDYKKRVSCGGKILARKKNQQHHQADVSKQQNYRNSLSQISLASITGSPKHNKKNENTSDVPKFDDNSIPIPRNEISETVIDVLNQLQSHSNSLTELARRISSMPIDREPKLIHVILEIYDKAAKEDNFGKPYVMLCEHLQNWSIIDRKTGKESSFKSQLITVIHLKCSQIKFKIGEFERNGESEKEARYDLRGKIIEYYRFLLEFLKSPVFGPELLIFPAMELVVLLENIDEDVTRLLSEFLKILLNDLDLKLATLEYRLRSSKGINIKLSTQELEKYNTMFTMIAYLQELINFRENGVLSRKKIQIPIGKKIAHTRSVHSFLKKHPFLIEDAAKRFQVDSSNEELVEPAMGALFKSFDSQSEIAKSENAAFSKFSYALLLRCFCENIPSWESFCIKTAFVVLKKLNYSTELLPKVLECLYLYDVIPYESFIEYEEIFLSNQISEIIDIFNSSTFKKYKLSRSPQEN